MVTLLQEVGEEVRGPPPVGARVPRVAVALVGRARGGAPRLVDRPGRGAPAGCGSGGRQPLELTCTLEPKKIRHTLSGPELSGFPAIEPGEPEDKHQACQAWPKAHPCDQGTY